MPTLNDVLAGSLAQAVQVQQIIDALKGTPNKGVPVSLVSLNDSTNYALTVQNDDPTSSRALLVLKSDGTTLIEADATGVTLGSPVNLPAGSVNGGTALANASVTNAKLGPDVARANLLTNPSFDIWQRGTGAFTANGVYGPDRWSISLAASDTLSVSQDTVNVDSGSYAAAACTFVLSGGAGSTQLQQKVDGQLRGRTISISLRVRTSTGTAVRVGLNDGTQTYSSYHSGGGAYETLTATKTISTSATTVLVQVFFAASCTAYLDNACLVVGSQPADYVPVHPADDLARCKRYYEPHLVSSGAGSLTYRGYGAAGGQQIGGTFFYKAEKAVVPTVTVTNAWTVTNCSSPSLGGVGLLSCDLYSPVSGAGYAIFYANTGGQGVIVEANP